jgi:hypothetical protein
MQTLEEELESKIVTISKLNVYLSGRVRFIGQQGNQITNLKSELKKTQDLLEPTRVSLNLLTAAHGKLLRKIKRQENTNGKR